MVPHQFTTFVMEKSGSFNIFLLSSMISKNVISKDLNGRKSNDIFVQSDNLIRNLIKFLLTILLCLIYP